MAIIFSENSTFSNYLSEKSLYIHSGFAPVEKFLSKNIFLLHYEKHWGKLPALEFSRNFVEDHEKPEGSIFLWRVNPTFRYYILILLKLFCESLL